MSDAVPPDVTDPAEVWRLRALDASVQFADAVDRRLLDQATIADLQSRLEQAEASLDRVRRSRSWRLTAPLRRGGSTPPDDAGAGHVDPQARHALFEQRMRAAYDARRVVWADPDTPTTLNEKVWHRRLVDRRPVLRTWCDKRACWEHARAVIGDDWVMERIAVVESGADLRTADLPGEFVVKATHGSGGSAVVWDGPTLPGQGHEPWFRRAYRAVDVPWADLVTGLDACLARDYGWDYLEWGYLDVTPAVVVDRLYRGPDGGVPEDVALLVFHGRVEAIRCAKDRQRAVNRHGAATYDRDWRKLPVAGFAPAGSYERPAQLEAAIEAAEALAAEEEFLRVDFIATAEGLRFTECTPYHLAGNGIYRTEAADRLLGALW